MWPDFADSLSFALSLLDRSDGFSECLSREEEDRLLLEEELEGYFGDLVDSLGFLGEEDDELDGLLKPSLADLELEDAEEECFVDSLDREEDAW